MGSDCWSSKENSLRLLILSVAMGYGVVRPTLGGLTSKVLLLGITYFLATELLDIAENVGTNNDISGKARLFLVLPVAFLDAFLILWIFYFSFANFGKATGISNQITTVEVSKTINCNTISMDNVRVALTASYFCNA